MWLAHTTDSHDLNGLEKRGAAHWSGDNGELLLFAKIIGMSSIFSVLHISYMHLMVVIQRGHLNQDYLMFWNGNHHKKTLNIKWFG